MNLRKYQEEGVRFLVTHSGALLADAMGLGKSATALLAAQKVGGKLLIVCPSYVRGVWAAPGGESDKWRGILPYVPSSTRSDLIQTSVQCVVIHYDILHAWVKSLREWSPRCVILDECHMLGNEKTRRSIAVKAIASSCMFRWGLSGTPMTNRPKDLWNILNTLVPGRFGRFFPYALKYCGAAKKQVTPIKIVWDFSGASNLEELNYRLKDVMLRRTLEDVRLELPAKTRQCIVIDVGEFTSSAVSAYTLRSSLEGIADRKFPEVLETVLAHVATGMKVVAFTHRRSVAEMLVNIARASGLDAELVHGGLSQVDRDKGIVRAKGALGGCLVAATIDSAGVGVDFSFASVACFVELSYEPHKLLQAEARLHRHGQQRPVLIQYFLAAGSLDEIVASKVLSKLDVFESAVGSTGETLAEGLMPSSDSIVADMCAAISAQFGGQ